MTKTTQEITQSLAELTEWMDRLIDQGREKMHSGKTIEKELGSLIKEAASNMRVNTGKSGYRNAVLIAVDVVDASNGYFGQKAELEAYLGELRDDLEFIETERKRL